MRLQWETDRDRAGRAGGGHRLLPQDTSRQLAQAPAGAADFAA